MRIQVGGWRLEVGKKVLWCAGFLVLLYLLSTIHNPPSALACPSCKEVFSGQDPASLQLARGYARSIYLLMSAPYLLFAGLAFTIARSSRRNRKPG